MKGLAIIVIMVHNFAHYIKGSILENQHIFNLENHNRLMECLQNGGPDILLNLFSHYGHYGVTVFVLLSGYGLAMKYENMPGKISLWDFIRNHIVKLWLLLLPMLIFHLIFFSIYIPGYFNQHWTSFIGMALLIENFRPDSYFFDGPWWFFSLIVQLYIIYRLCVYRRPLKSLVLLTAGCLAMQIFAMAVYGNGEFLKYLNYNFVGVMLPFAIGIVMARKRLYPSTASSILALLLFIVCCFNQYTWLLTFGLIPVAVLPLSNLVKSSRRLNSAIKWIGSLSAYLFVVHPTARFCTFWLCKYVPVYVSILVYLAVCIFYAYVYRYLIIRYGNRLINAHGK